MTVEEMSEEEMSEEEMNEDEIDIDDLTEEQLKRRYSTKLACQDCAKVLKEEEIEFFCQFCQKATWCSAECQSWGIDGHLLSCENLFRCEDCKKNFVILPPPHESFTPLHSQERRFTSVYCPTCGKQLELCYN